MERDKFKKVVYELRERLEITLGSNIETGEIGLRINGIPSEYDIIFIKKNRDKIIEILSEDMKNKKIEIEMPKDLYNFYLKNSESNNTSLEKEIINILKKFKEEECQK